MYEIPNQVTVVIMVNEPVIEYYKRILRRAAEIAGLPLSERNLFADAYVFRENLQGSERIPLNWSGSDPTPRDDANVKTDDFNFLLLQRYLNLERSGAIVRRGRSRTVSLADIQTVVGGVLATSTLSSTIKDALTLWRNDFRYRGGILGSEQDAPVSRGALVPALQTPAASPDITWIPSQMRAKGWNEGAELMEAWFSKPAQIRAARIEDTPNGFGPPIIDVIKMDWTLGFPRAKAMYDEMMNGRLWRNDAAKKLLGERLVGAGMIARARAAPGQIIGFGNLASSNVVNNHANYVQSRTVTQPLTEARDKPDGLTASLANFQFYMTVRGTLSSTNTGIQVKLEEVGVYLRDSYDFLNDGFKWGCLCSDQPLGEWNEGVGAVTNDSFNNWRRLNGRGGDFLVYSDVKRTAVNPADNTFIVPV